MVSSGAGRMCAADTDPCREGSGHWIPPQTKLQTGGKENNLFVGFASKSGEEKQEIKEVF